MKKLIKVNLGCGPVGIKGWINYDSGVLPLLSKYPKFRHLVCTLGLLPKNYDVVWPNIELLDIRKKFPLKNDSVDFIYCSQVLEHFERYETLRILSESLRVLKPGGIMRISVPDIAKMLDIYQKLSRTSLDSAAQEINLIWWGYEKDGPAPSVISKISKLFIRDHQWHYDQISMKEILKEVGFSKIKFQGFRKGVTPELKKLELDLHREHSLYVEVTK